jgi:hypothetical protein
MNNAHGRAAEQSPPPRFVWVAYAAGFFSWRVLSLGRRRRIAGEHRDRCRIFDRFWKFASDS